MTVGKGTLDGKVAIVTGGATGLGRADCLLMAREGADIVVAGILDDANEQTAKEIMALGRRALAIHADVTDSQHVSRMVEQTLSEMGRLDILVNNVGIVRGEIKGKEIWEITDKEWHLGMDTNVTSTFYCSRAVIKYFVERNAGKIINIASGMGLRGGKGNYMYGTAKAGVINLTRVLAMSYARYNIQVNCVAPGQIGSSGGGDISQRKAAVFQPMGRFGVPDDIGHTVLFLASDASNYITGALFNTDGAAQVSGFAPTGFTPIINVEEV
jgi:NAD(P)-dependent dehydrogenase (short-subunit alcohol dehydrogenase family)